MARVWLYLGAVSSLEKLRLTNYIVKSNPWVGGALMNQRNLTPPSTTIIMKARFHIVDVYPTKGQLPLKFKSTPGCPTRPQVPTGKPLEIELPGADSTESEIRCRGFRPIRNKFHPTRPTFCDRALAQRRLQARERALARRSAPICYSSSSKLGGGILEA